MVFDHNTTFPEQPRFFCRGKGTRSDVFRQPVQYTRNERPQVIYLAFPFLRVSFSLEAPTERRSGNARIVHPVAFVRLWTSYACLSPRSTRLLAWLPSEGQAGFCEYVGCRRSYRRGAGRYKRTAKRHCEAALASGRFFVVDVVLTTFIQLSSPFFPR